MNSLPLNYSIMYDLFNHDFFNHELFNKELFNHALFIHELFNCGLFNCEFLLRSPSWSLGLKCAVTISKCPNPEQCPPMRWEAECLMSYFKVNIFLTTGSSIQYWNYKSRTFKNFLTYQTISHKKYNNELVINPDL